jgi:subtilisin family serine protease
MNEPDKDTRFEALWARRRLRDMKEAGILEGPGYLYRAGECLVAAEDEERLRNALRREGGREDQEQNAQLNRLELGVRKWTMREDADIPSLLRRLRSMGTEDWQPRVAPNTVFSGEPRYVGGPGGPPQPAIAARATSKPSSGGGEPHIGVLDTGYAADVESLHPDLFSALRPDCDDLDELDIDSNGLLDAEAGHGTFICGLVSRLAPGLVIDPERVLDPRGWGDDLSVGLGIAQQKSGVINLSLGAYAEDDQPPLALERALRRLGRDVVVVAAAGNNSSDRPFWPAAFKQVVAVAAVDTTSGTPAPARFSNFGRWVDVCAPGVDLWSTYVRGSWQLDRAQSPESFEGWASWSGTSFAAPVFAAAVAREAAASGSPPRRVAAQLLAGLDYLPGAEDYGVYYDPGVDLLPPA